eukprot:TRINITY_DN3217_c0_g1_i1.p1 TRINITY_DN3217_c0_g1~~TRINITY_DN3217_c0_g1_i1.p1  ORF type:complete len:129 (-),score=16.94 TRINITY_DN3217_c0_g1_i1:700-1086(-)
MCMFISTSTFERYFLQLDFFAEVRHMECDVVITKTGIDVTIPKKIAKEWDELTSKGTRLELFQRRKKSIARERQREKDQRKRKRQQRQKDEKSALRSYWDIQKTERSARETLKSRSRKEAEVGCCVYS